MVTNSSKIATNKFSGEAFVFIAWAARAWKAMIVTPGRSSLRVTLVMVAGALADSMNIASAVAAQPLGAAPVAITDSALSPQAVTIPVGGSVLWTNRGTGVHDVIADRDAFKSFRLAPSSSSQVSFAVPGSFPYAVDGKIKGTVFVVAGSGTTAPSSSPSGSSAGPDNCGNPKILHYDVSVAVHTADTVTWPPGERHGTMMSVIDWQTHWANVEMSVERCRGGLTILIPARVSVTPDETARQSIAADTKTLDWTDNSNSPSSSAVQVPPCHFTNVTTFRTGMFLQARLYAHSGSDFQFFAGRAQPWPREPFQEKCELRVGNNGGVGLGQGFGPRTPGYAPINHLDFSINTINIDLNNHHRGDDLTFPLAELALGQGFTFNSGELHAASVASGNVATTVWAAVSVTPVRP